MSKGDKTRPYDKKAYDNNYDGIDWGKKPKLSKDQMKELLEVVSVQFNKDTEIKKKENDS